MPGLLDDAAGKITQAEAALQEARLAWQESMTRQLDELRKQVLSAAPQAVAARAGGCFQDQRLEIDYWGTPLWLQWPELTGAYADGKPVSTFDTAMLLYYLSSAGSTALSGRWISFRELPGGSFYNRAFQGYSGDALARRFGTDPQAFVSAAERLGGTREAGLSEWTFAFSPLPHVRLAAALWPGDEEFPARASILFDATCKDHMTTDGLALLGSGLTRRLLAAAGREPRSAQDG